MFPCEDMLHPVSSWCKHPSTAELCWCNTPIVITNRGYLVHCSDFTPFLVHARRYLDTSWILLKCQSCSHFNKKAFADRAMRHMRWCQPTVPIIKSLVIHWLLLAGRRSGWSLIWSQANPLNVYFLATLKFLVQVKPDLKHVRESLHFPTNIKFTFLA